MVCKACLRLFYGFWVIAVIQIFTVVDWDRDKIRTRFMISGADEVRVQ